jgi:hypothetical protein
MEETHSITLSLNRSAGKIPLTTEQTEKFLKRLINEVHEAGFEFVTAPTLDVTE